MIRELFNWIRLESSLMHHKQLESSQIELKSSPIELVSPPIELKGSLIEL